MARLRYVAIFGYSHESAVIRRKGSKCYLVRNSKNAGKTVLVKEINRVRLDRKTLLLTVIPAKAGIHFQKSPTPPPPFAINLSRYFKILTQLL